MLEIGKGRDNEKEKKPKKSGDGIMGKGTGDRLSIFGSTFGGTLGKGRKPPPKFPQFVPYSSFFRCFLKSCVMYSAIDEASSDHSPLSFFGLSSNSRKVSERERPTTSSGTATPKARSSGKEPRDPALLRKRTSSVPVPPANITSKPGSSILEQIGEADHKGWMRKKGDRYNTWKLRYFVLRGPDLYCLRSNSPVVCY